MLSLSLLMTSGHAAGSVVPNGGKLICAQLISAVLELSLTCPVSGC